MRVSGNTANTTKMNSMKAMARYCPYGQNGTGKPRAATSSRLRLRRMDICESRIINHTQTTEKVTSEANIRNSSFGIR
ncbi:hypothetical protein D3C72_2340280 [compost metagenome]